MKMIDCSIPGKPTEWSRPTTAAELKQMEDDAEAAARETCNPLAERLTALEEKLAKLTEAHESTLAHVKFLIDKDAKKG